MGQAEWSGRGMRRGMLAAAVALVLIASVGVMQAAGAPAEELRAQLRAAVIGYVEVASSLVDAETGALLDPHETICACYAAMKPALPAQSVRSRANSGCRSGRHAQGGSAVVHMWDSSFTCLGNSRCPGNSQRAGNALSGGAIAA